MVWRCLGGGAGEEDELIFGLKDLRDEAGETSTEVSGWCIARDYWKEMTVRNVGWLLTNP